eukprot:gene4349-5078_t
MSNSNGSSQPAPSTPKPAGPQPKKPFVFVKKESPFPTATHSNVVLPKAEPKAPATCKVLGNSTFEINGHKIKFPFQPYDTQVEMISCIIDALKGGHNALLESATGTGKTLSLLCASLEWQSIRKAELESEQRSRADLDARARNASNEAAKRLKAANAGAVKLSISTAFGNNNKDDDSDLQSDYVAPRSVGKRPLPTGSQEAPVMLDESDDEHGDHDAAAAAPPTDPPTIFFCSRTHSQIKQLTSELARTPYRPNMCVLASRDHYCVNPKLADVSKKKERCKKAVKDRECRYHKKEGNYVMSTSGKFRSGGEMQVWDIEDLLNEGRDTHECPFYASKGMVKRANLIFCPYNYIIEPSIRGVFKDKFQGSIVIFDEAHNIEDALMSAASFDITREDLREVAVSFKNILSSSSLSEMLSAKAMESVEMLFYMIERIDKWIGSKMESLTETDFEKQSNVWHGLQVVTILEEMGINKGNYKNVMSAIDALSEGEDEILKEKDKEQGKLKESVKIRKEKDSRSEIISERAMGILESFTTVVWFLYEHMQFIADFKLILQKTSLFVQGSGTKWQTTFSIWAMNPRVAFKSISDQTRSVILTSGTLSPLTSFSSELASPFPVTAELGNLADIKQRVWIGTLGIGVNGVKLDATYKSSELLEFQDGLGDAILKHIQLIPGGVLVFFPSYAFLEKLLNRWTKTGLLKKLEAHKKVFTEPKTAKQFPAILEGYQEAVTTKRGSILFSVCRGKVSEGINFSDEYARGVIVVGIPLPNIKDLRVDLKKKYNDINSRKTSMMNGNAALNQAIGRCIRHKDDYGSILLIDERFTNEGVWPNLSKWARMCIANNKTLDKSLVSLKDFFVKRKKIEDKKYDLF